MTEPIIELRDLSFRYYASKQDALKSINMKIFPGEWVAVIGPNGSGKSTMAKIINGLLIPSQGQVWIKGQLLNETTVWQARRSVGMVFQNPDNQFVGATVEDDVAFGLENNGIERDEMVGRIHSALKEVRMDAFLTKEPARLSGGQKQRVALAGIIALRPDVIILDEATAMLDPLGRAEVIQVVRKIKDQFNLTVISITHDIDEAALADRIFVMEQGRLVKQDQPSDIFALGQDLIKAGLDIPFTWKLKEALKARGVEIPEQIQSEEALLSWISQSYLSK
ncbi:energy-coupling factor ABC transporter ATP-binding protein [Vaginisenegalia massiliensis]|uniref:energy-coupling factor ABC transporter ATP-binding protein n=1 Tax=Vaginisenegalia massiliensis TaxID=2058294 RepID=UPI000F52B2CE|nr:energy-coupling factor ABC transporter ATP-binding protein [Vaginisenegalia massiliensis]